MPRHLSDSELAGFLDGDLADRERAHVETHLEACDECRAELIDVARLLSEAESAAADTASPTAAPPTATSPTAERPPRAQRPPSRWRLPAGVGGLAAAAVVATLILWPAGPGVTDRPMEERLRTEGAERLEAHFPAPDGVIQRGALRFEWSSHDAGSYRITVTAEDGALIWSQTLADTVVVPPTDLELGADRFFWYVDAIDVGVVARTGARAFTIAP